MEQLALIRERAMDMRDMFERVLHDSIGSSQTEGACLYAAILLASTLTKFAKAPSVVCGGGPPLDGGLKDRTGNLRGHYWVAGTCETGQEFVADITADQFGYEKVVVLDAADAAVLYFPGDATLIAGHVEEEQKSWA